MNDEKKEELISLLKMKDSLCLHQWDFPCVNLSSGKVRSCCRVPPRPLEENTLSSLGKEAIFNSQYNQDRRLDMLEGVRHQECSSCWVLEENGAPSPRLGIPVFFEKMQKRLKISQSELIRLMLSPRENEKILKSYHAFELEISFGNRCDLACTYCSYMYSSRIALEEIEAGRLDKSAYEKEMKADTRLFQNVFWEWFADSGMKTLEVVNIIGGEPLINDLFYENIERMIEVSQNTKVKREKKILLQIITNLNAPPHYLKKFIAQIPRLAEHFDLSLLASMESTGKRAEYIRYGLDWQRFVSNFEEVLTTSHRHLYQFGFLSSINALSVSSLEDFVRFVLDLRKKYQWPVYLAYNQVVNPSVMSVVSLNSDFTSYISRALALLENEKDHVPSSWEGYRNGLRQMEEAFRNLKTDPQNRDQLKIWIADNDKKRGSRFLEVFPEYADYLK